MNAPLYSSKKALSRGTATARDLAELFPAWPPMNFTARQAASTSIAFGSADALAVSSMAKKTMGLITECALRGGREIEAPWWAESVAGQGSSNTGYLWACDEFFSALGYRLNSESKTDDETGRIIIQKVMICW